MTWRIVLHRTAARSLKTAPAKDRERIQSALRSMTENPFGGDVSALHGAREGSYRRRVGSWRLLFVVHTDTNTINVVGIVRRTSSTY